MTFEGHFSLGCYFSNLWQAFASRGLQAIAELLVELREYFKIIRNKLIDKLISAIAIAIAK